MIITLAFMFYALRLPSASAHNPSHQAKRLEIASASTLLLSVAAPLFSLNLGGEVLPWSHPVVIILFGLTPVFIAMFYYAETRMAMTPVIPKRFITNRNIAVALACTLPMKFCFDQVGHTLRSIPEKLIDLWQLRFSFGTYVEARSLGHKTPFSDWALTCIYLGRSLGTLLSGIVVRRYRKFKRFLQINIVIDVLIYLLLGMGRIREFSSRLFATCLT